MVQDGIPVVWSPSTRLHDPRKEVWVGVELDGAENPERIDVILAALTASGYDELVDAVAHDRSVLERVHAPEMLAFLAEAAQRWAEGGYEAEVGQSRVVPYLFPTPALTEGMPVRVPTRVHADAGRFVYDTCTLISQGTWEAALAAVDCTLTAVDLVAGGRRTAYALTRPPGHHATKRGMGGSCYLNNAAVAAEALRDAGHERVAVIDVDAHQGNGTAQIFYDRADVAYGSVHIDPGAGWFPHLLGFVDETGTGAGAGATLNVPLPPETPDGPWVAAVERIAEWVAGHGSTALVVSLGVDAAVDDPESPLRVTTDGYGAAGGIVGSLGLPSVIVQEGGYHLPSLGGLVGAYLDGHRAASGE